jgi:hypothetical protein
MRYNDIMTLQTRKEMQAKIDNLAEEIFILQNMVSSLRRELRPKKKSQILKLKSTLSGLQKTLDSK